MILDRGQLKDKITHLAQHHGINVTGLSLGRDDKGQLFADVAFSRRGVLHTERAPIPESLRVKGFVKDTPAVMVAALVASEG